MARSDAVPVRHEGTSVKRLSRSTLPPSFLRHELRRRIVPPVLLPELIVHLRVVGVAAQRHELGLLQRLPPLLALRTLHIPLLLLRHRLRPRGLFLHLLPRFRPLHRDVDDPAARIAVDGLRPLTDVLVAVLQKALALRGLLARHLRGDLAGGLQARVGARLHLQRWVLFDDRSVVVGEGKGGGFLCGGGDDGVCGGLVCEGGRGGPDDGPGVFLALAEFGGPAD